MVINTTKTKETSAIECGKSTTVSHQLFSLIKALLNRWLTSIVILIPKDIGRPQIHRFRIINTYDSEYNLILEYFWPKQGMKRAETKKWLGKNQTDVRMLLRS